MPLQFFTDPTYRENFFLYFPQVIPSLVIDFIALFVLIAIFFSGMIAPIAGLSVYIERRLSAKMQSRIGCNRLGPEGILQILADGIKLITKEDFMPKGADPFLFKIAPFFVMVGAFVSFAVIPFSSLFVLADLHVGVVFLLALSSVVVIGIMLAGWSSNNKWSILGSLRSAAQIVSYEIPLGLALLIPVLITGSMNLQEIGAFQKGGVNHWLIFFAGPFTIVAFFVYFISAIAEVNRTPFDLPEAESELVSGFHTEYSGIRWGLFFIGEYTNMFLISCIAVTIFLGGYHKSIANIPFVWITVYFSFFLLLHVLTFIPGMCKKMISGDSFLDVMMKNEPKALSRTSKMLCALISLFISVFLHRYHDESALIQTLVFISKSYFLVLIIMWLRWSLPRYRIDQLMDLCWKNLIPLSFLCVCGTMIWMVIT
ncbi:MAG: NADH-quinone oxidoreductase subunit H [Bdellovibrionales bacterium]|nr:NADH-quinone oxidoreductase subunit H [Bdellovibrionales bacterium]